MNAPNGPRAFLMREWPYLAILVLSLVGVAYTSVAQRPITTYWLALAPFIGIICVITRWRDAENREQRSRLVWTQVLHWAAVLAAMRRLRARDVSIAPYYVLRRLQQQRRKLMRVRERD